MFHLGIDYMYTFFAALMAFGLSFIPLTAEEEETLQDTSYTFNSPHESEELANCCYPCQEYDQPAIYYDGPPPCCFSCNPCCSHFYFGLEGGWAIGLGYADRITDVGFRANGAAYNTYAHSGYNVGANLGYRWSCVWRTDLSYTYIKPSSYQWRLDDFLDALADNRLKARLHSHLVLLNTYLHLNALYCFLPWLDPYITGGIGVAINHLDHIQQKNQFGAFIANIYSHRDTHFGARVGIGAMKYFCRSWIIDFGFNANYIGRVASKDKQTNAIGTEQIIGPYHFENNWIGTFYLGLKYAF